MKANGDSDMDVANKFKEIGMIRKKIESLGISVASVHNMASMKGISTLLDEELKTRAKPRRKHKFSQIKPVKEPSGGVRFMCKPTILKVDGTRGRTTIASSVGGTREECEINVFKTMCSNLNQYCKSLAGKPEEQIKCYEKVYSDYKNFRTVVKSKKVQNAIDVMLEKITTNIIFIKGEGKDV